MVIPNPTQKLELLEKTTAVDAYETCMVGIFEVAWLRYDMLG